MQCNNTVEVTIERSTRPFAVNRVTYQWMPHLQYLQLSAVEHIEKCVNDLKQFS